VGTAPTAVGGVDGESDAVMIELILPAAQPGWRGFAFPSGIHAASHRFHRLTSRKLWCHWLGADDYRRVEDVTDYAAAEHTE
jgi:hypothetical protein